jgi:hypothetical protein
MTRHPLAAALALAVVTAISPASRAQDEILFFNRKTQKEERLKAVVLEEAPGKISYRVGSGDPEEIAATDVVEIDYQAPKTINNVDYRDPFGKERRAALEKDPAKRKETLQQALAGYRAILPKLEGSKAHRRNAHFHIAQVLARLAEDDPSQLDAALEAATRFKKEHGDGWQLVRAVKLLVRLQEQKGDAAGAVASYEEAAANEALPPEVRHEFGLLAVRHLLRKGQHEAASKKARALQADVPKDDPLAPRVEVYVAACDTAAGRLDGVEKRLKAVLEGGAGGDVKGLARNTLGDYYRAKGQAEDAFWQYLWVDVYYNQDREELARALYHLAKLYAEVRKDALRSRECLERLCDEKEFGGLEYHKRALAERPAEGGS